MKKTPWTSGPKQDILCMDSEPVELVPGKTKVKLTQTDFTEQGQKVAKLNQERRTRQAAAKQLRTNEWKKHAERVRKAKKILSWKKEHRAPSEELMASVLQDKASLTDLDRPLSSSTSIEIGTTTTHEAHRKSSAEKVTAKTRKKRSHGALDEDDMEIAMQKAEVLQTSKRRRRN